MSEKTSQHAIKTVSTVRSVSGVPMVFLGLAFGCTVHDLTTSRYGTPETPPYIEHEPQHASQPAKHVCWCHSLCVKLHSSQRLMQYMKRVASVSKLSL